MSPRSSLRPQGETGEAHRCLGALSSSGLYNQPSPTSCTLFQAGHPRLDLDPVPSKFGVSDALSELRLCFSLLLPLPLPFFLHAPPSHCGLAELSCLSLFFRVTDGSPSESSVLVSHAFLSGDRPRLTSLSIRFTSRTRCPRPTHRLSCGRQSLPSLQLARSRIDN